VTKGNEADADEELELVVSRSRRRRRKALVTAAAITMLVTVGWFLRPTGPAATAAGEPAPDVPVQDGDLIRFSPAFARRAQLTTAPASVHTMAPTVRAAGTVTFDARKFAAVGARVSGRTRRIFRMLGDHVKVGEPLAEVESAELGRAEAQLLAARAKEKAAEAQMVREQRLADAHIVSAREAETAVAAREAARAERVAVEQSVAVLGGDGQGEIGVFVLRSPIEGRVVAAKFARGQTVGPTDTLYEIADLGSVWVALEVFERDIGTIRLGDHVQITAPDRGKLSVQGRVAHVGDFVDRQTRTAAVRVVVDNPKLTLRPGQSVSARIETTAPAADLVSVPLQAVTRVDGSPTVFVAVDANTIGLRRVTTGPEDRTRVAIVDGLQAGENVVVGGVFALKSELFR
jgi:cobalt-zinc-cadmium efflux system membrane fusion protein